MRSPGSDRRVFVDTSAYYAAIDRRDFDHDATAAVMRRLVEEQRPLVTTNAVLFELHGLLLNRIDLAGGVERPYVVAGQPNGGARACTG